MRNTTDKKEYFSACVPKEIRGIQSEKLAFSSISDIIGSVKEKRQK